MASVDMAFERVSRELDLQTRYWRLWDQSEWVEAPGGSRPSADGQFLDETSVMTYWLARGQLDDFLDADAIVFWGDFHHMAVYQRQTVDVLCRRMRVMDRSDAERLTAQFLLLRGQPREVLERVLTFGTTLGFNTPADYSGPYGEDLKRFVAGARAAWFRDGYSARVGELIRVPSTESCLGADAAFLADGPSHDPATASGLGVFIGRSKVPPEKVARLGKALSGHFGAGRWVPWGTAPAMWPMWGRKRLRLAWPELEAGGSLSAKERLGHSRRVLRGPGLSDEIVPAAVLFERVAGCRVILTDTYHLAVNAWRIGTPAILIHDRPTSTGWNVNDGGAAGRDKRHDLYSQLDALPLLIATDRIPSGDAVKTLIESVDRLREPVCARARQIAEHAHRRFSASLSELL